LTLRPESEERAALEERIANLRRRAEERESERPAERESGEEPLAPAPTDEGLSAWQWAGIGAFALAGAAGAVALGTGLRSSAIHDDLEAGCSADRTCPPELSGDIDRGRAMGRASTATTFILLAGAAAGATFFLLDGRHDDEPSVALDLGPSYAGLRSTIRFGGAR
jgi:hypothetical protein